MVKEAARVALTRAAWDDCVAWSDADDERKGTLQDEKGRLCDVLWMAINAARRNAGGHRMPFVVYRVSRTGRGVQPRKTVRTPTIGPGDEGEAAFTIM